MLMFDAIVENVYRQLEAKIHPAADPLSYYDLTGPDADELVRKIFMIHYEHLFQQERERILSGEALFQYESPAVQKSVDHFIDNLKKNFKISRQTAHTILKETLMIKLRFLVKPLETTDELMYTAVAAQPVTAVVAQMRQFEKFRYYPDALERYAKAKNLTHITKGQFRLLIQEINQSLFHKGNLDNILKVCGLIIKDLNELIGKNSDSLDIDILIEAFKDRQLDDYVMALNIEKELDNKEMNLYGLRQVLNRFIILQDKQALTGLTAETPVIEKPIVSNEQPALVPEPVPVKSPDQVSLTGKKPDEDSGELIDINNILSQKSIHLNHEPTGITGSVKTEPKTVERDVHIPSELLRPESIDREITGQFIKQELVEKFDNDTKSIKLLRLKEAEVLVPVETLITAKDEKIILKKIFNNNQNEYQEFIRQINITRKWKQAMNFIDMTLNQHRVDPYCKEAIRLSDIVYTRYYPPEE